MSISDDVQVQLISSIAKLVPDTESYKESIKSAIIKGGSIDKLPKDGITYLEHVLRDKRVTPEHVKALIEAVKEAYTDLYAKPGHEDYHDPSYMMQRLLNGWGEAQYMQGKSNLDLAVERLTDNSEVFSRIIGYMTDRKLVGDSPAKTAAQLQDPLIEALEKGADKSEVFNAIRDGAAFSMPGPKGKYLSPIRAHILDVITGKHPLTKPDVVANLDDSERFALARRLIATPLEAYYEEVQTRARKRTPDDTAEDMLTRALNTADGTGCTLWDDIMKLVLDNNELQRTRAHEWVTAQEMLRVDGVHNAFAMSLDELPRGEARFRRIDTRAIKQPRPREAPKAGFEHWVDEFKLIMKRYIEGKDGGDLHAIKAIVAQEFTDTDGRVIQGKNKPQAMVALGTNGETPLQFFLEHYVFSRNAPDLENGMKDARSARIQDVLALFIGTLEGNGLDLLVREVDDGRGAAFYGSLLFDNEIVGKLITEARRSAAPANVSNNADLVEAHQQSAIKKALEKLPDHKRYKRLMEYYNKSQLGQKAPDPIAEEVVPHRPVPDRGTPERPEVVATVSHDQAAANDPGMCG